MTPFLNYPVTNFVVDPQLAHRPMRLVKVPLGSGSAEFNRLKKVNDERASGRVRIRDTITALRKMAILR